jgi:hypothetical protein
MFTCAHCSKPLAAGRSEFYLVQILAVADPSNIQIEALDAEETERQIDALLKQLRGMSGEEATNQVYRRVVIHLCCRCYGRWIDDPTGRGAAI